MSCNDTVVTDDGVDAETSLSFFLSLFMCTSLLRLFFTRAHYWVNKYILKNACELQRVVLYFKEFCRIGFLKRQENLKTKEHVSMPAGPEARESPGFFDLTAFSSEVLIFFCTVVQC